MARVPVGLYRHAKTERLYWVLNTSTHTETGDRLVNYMRLYRHPGVPLFFSRPEEMFRGSVAIDGAMKPRFERVAWRNVVPLLRQALRRNGDGQ